MRLAVTLTLCLATLAAATMPSGASAQGSPSQANTKPAKCPTGANLQTGTVKFFNDQKGYGFIIPAKGGADIFVHHSALGDLTIKEGDHVAFEVTEGPKGPVAGNVKVCG